MDRASAPVLVCGFSRQEGMISVVESAIESGVTRIYCALDGSRNVRENEIQDSIVRELTKIAGSHEITLFLLRRSQNLGLAVAIVSAIDWFFENEDSGIIFEDDLQVDPRFYQFAGDALLKLKGDTETWAISGNQFFTDLEEGLDIQWAHYPMIWGWATWQERWVEIRKEIFSPKLDTPSGIGLKLKSFLRVGKFRASHGLIDSWAIPFSIAMKVKGKYCFMPPENLVENIGRDSYASHTTSKMWHLERARENFGRVSKMEVEVRGVSALVVDKLIEKNIYRVSWKSSISYFLLKVKSFTNLGIRSESNSLKDNVSNARLIERVERLS
jgi:hypothetical protein